MIFYEIRPHENDYRSKLWRSESETSQLSAVFGIHRRRKKTVSYGMYNKSNSPLRSFLLSNKTDLNSMLVCRLCITWSFKEKKTDSQRRAEKINVTNCAVL